MHKTILITGATDGIGLATAKTLTKLGHRVLLHGRSATKLAQAQKAVAQAANKSDSAIEVFLADLSTMDAVRALVTAVLAKHIHLDVLINNAGIFKTTQPITPDGFDVRFAVNTLAPYLLTQQLLPIIPRQGRVINLSSAAQAPVNLEALVGTVKIADDFTAYAQSKLAITAWSRQLATTLASAGPIIIAVNPGSMLGSKMVQEGFGVQGSDLNIGADILCRAALADEFLDATGKYFDNDAKCFAPPHPDALDSQKSNAIVETIEHLLNPS
ncbi:SDR family NAD(P)-dependent oxidoreductase [Marinagarivorans algicola]|uniref:SDR family NAD(P)-dependent oxidoreductase n=1 Tax=Marinagarivorans algicola TaxID=1513270 RepID=UPI0006B8BCB6|nr:SDR family NAD(P)-dependent oxidoreductase [Marinagarivorans algicola]